VKSGAYRRRGGGLSNIHRLGSNRTMINRGDIIWLGISSGVIGSLVGGIMLGIGMDLIVNGQPWGWLLLLPGAPVSAIPGWLLARKLARQI
jgi:F0F1-type ATP synthase assembly protein I